MWIVLPVDFPRTASVNHVREVDTRMNSGSTTASGVPSAILQSRLPLGARQAELGVWTSAPASLAITQ